MDELMEMKRWGLLLDTLAQISDTERQLVTQGKRPASFVPDELLSRWQHLFQGGRGLPIIGLSDAILAALLDFDYHLGQLVEILPDTADNKQDYIRNDEAWRAVREMADLTLIRVALLIVPDEPIFGQN